MKNLKVITPLLMTLALLTQVASAQKADLQTTDDFHSGDLPTEVATARCQYTSTDDACVDLIDSGQTNRTVHSDTDNNLQDSTILAQYPRRMPGPPMRGRRSSRPHYYGGYPGMWMEPPNGRRVAIGALIGFGIGAALGAHANNDHHPGAGVAAAFLVGGVGALVGAVAGCTPPLHAHHRHPRDPWPNADEQDQEASHRKHTKPGTPAHAEIQQSPQQSSQPSIEQTAIAQPTPSKPAPNATDLRTWAAVTR